MVHSWMSRLAATLFASHFLISSGLAQNVVSTTTSSSSASPTASNVPKNYTVQVGAGGFTYNPQSLSDVAIGSVITFEFFPPDHSVARAAFGSACVPYEYSGKNKTGFFSGTQYVSNVNQLTTWSLTINSTEPIFYYCTAPNSCIGQGMVGVINPNSTQTLALQVAAAKSAPFMVAPGQPMPNEAGSSSIANTPTASPTSSSSQPNEKGGSHGLSGGAIAGIVVGAVAFLAICAALFFFIGRAKTFKDVMQHQDPATKRKSTQETGELGAPEGVPYQQGHHASPSMASAHLQSPMVGYNDYSASGAPPMYGQHNATDSHASGWMSSPASHHMSMMSGMSGYTHQQMEEIKGAHMQQRPVELHSPAPGEGIAELDVPDPKTPEPTK